MHGAPGIFLGCCPGRDALHVVCLRADYACVMASALNEMDLPRQYACQY